MAFIDTLTSAGVVAVIRGRDADEAVAMVEALIRGGVRGIELTFTNPGCLEALKRVKALAPPEVLVGVGTVRSSEQLLAAVAEGAAFAVSPHFDPDIVCAALESDLPYLPGAITPTEIVQCWDSGAAAIKIFPGSLVGPDYIKAVRAPLPDIPLMPTGGVSVDNMAAWFAAGVVAVGMGGSLASGSPASIEVAAKAVMAELARIRGAAAQAPTRN